MSSIGEMSMLEFKTKLSENGRIILPAKCREAMHISPGETIIVRVENDEARIISKKNLLARAQAAVTKLTKGKKSLVDELIKMRRSEAQDE